MDDPEGVEIPAVADEMCAMEGTALGRLMVLIRATDREAFDRWYESAPYQLAKVRRHAASDTPFTAILQ